MAVKGIDYAWGTVPTVAALKAAGVQFVARYLSTDTTKNISKTEYTEYVKGGLAVVFCWETTSQRMLGGRAAGIWDATQARTELTALGVTGGIVYFACDWDASPAEQTAINEYLAGAVSILGKNHVGIYGGYYPVSRALTAGACDYAWQTYAWSGGQWDSRAHLRQIQNGVTVAGVSADWDQAMAADYGQSPRPAVAPVTPVQPAGSLPASGVQKHWGWCRKCSCLVYVNAGGDVCAYGGKHDVSQSWDYSENFTNP